MMGDRLLRRRGVFAAIALAPEMPMPTKVRWDDTGALWLCFDGPGAVEFVHAWAGFFNVPTGKEPIGDADERSLIHYATGWGQQRIVLYGTEPVEEPVEEMGDGVRELLEHIMEVAGDDTD